MGKLNKLTIAIIVFLLFTPGLITLVIDKIEKDQMRELKILKTKYAYDFAIVEIESLKIQKDVLQASCENEYTIITTEENDGN